MLHALFSRSPALACVRVREWVSPPELAELLDCAPWSQLRKLDLSGMNHLKELPPPHLWPRAARCST